MSLADRIDAVVEAYRADVRPIHAGASGLRQHYDRMASGL